MLFGASQALVLPEQCGLLAIYCLVGLVAGGIRAAQRPDPRPVLRDVAAQAAGGGLTGFLCGAFLTYQWGPEKFLLVVCAAGLAGWIGTIALDKAAAIVTARAERRARDALDATDPPPNPKVRQ